MSERERRFEDLLNDAHAGRGGDGRVAPDADLADLVGMARALHDVSVPEAPAAKGRVWARLEAELDADAPAEYPSRGSSVSQPATAGVGPAPVAARSHRLIWAVAAAVLLVCGVFGWGAGRAAAAALPDDPLYGVKLAQEWVALETATSDGRRGVVYTVLADHRLTEAAAEADRGSTPLVARLLAEYDIDLRQAISISAEMAARGEDNSQVLAAVASELARAVRIQNAAAVHGEDGFARSLGQSLQDNLQVIQSHQLKLPHSNNPGDQHAHPGGTPTPAPGSGGHGNPGHGNQTPTPGTDQPPGPPNPTPTPHGGGIGPGGHGP